MKQNITKAIKKAVLKHVHFFSVLLQFILCLVTIYLATEDEDNRDY